MNTVYDSFQENLKSIELFFDRLVPLALSQDETIIKETSELMKNSIIEELGIDPNEVNSEDFKAQLKANVTKKQLEKFIYRIMKIPKIPPRNYDILTRSSFISLNNYFECLFSDLLNFYFKNYPGLITEKKISISISDLTKYGAIDEAKEDLIQREIEKICLDLNFEELKDYFRSKLEVPLEEKIIDWEKINEIRERRHIIVHNNSIINKKYINRSKNPYNLKEGDQVNIDEKYFYDSLEAIKLSGSLLIFNCWGKWDKINATKAIEQIMLLTFDNLKDRHFDFVKKICEYAKLNIKPKNDDEENYMLRILYNYCIALKRLGEHKKLNLNLKKIKVGTLAPIFKIAQAILSDDYDEYFENLKKAQMADDLSMDIIMDWPLFEDIRTNPEYLKKTESILT